MLIGERMAKKVKITGMGKVVDKIAAPLYRDAFQPFAKQAGKGLETLGRALNYVLAPLEDRLWKYEQAKRFARTRLVEKLERTPLEQITEKPKASVFVPAIEAAALADGNPDLEELFANLIASAMDKRFAMRAFPAFTEIMKQLTPDEAKIMRAIGAGRPVPMVHLDLVFFDDQAQHVGGDTAQSNLSRFGFVAGCEHPRLIPSYINNLVRLGLLEVLAPNTWFNGQEAEYKAIEADPYVVALKKQHERAPRVLTNFIRSGVRLSPLGKDFSVVCVQPYEQRAMGESKKTRARRAAKRKRPEAG